MITIICGIIDLLSCLINLMFGITNISTDAIWVTCVNMFAAGFCFCGFVYSIILLILDRVRD